MPNVPASGWQVAITHPTTSRTITPQVLSRPQLLPSLNSLPEIRIPVKPSAAWLSDGFDDDPQMDVWLDGVKQPIDILTNVEDRAGETVLVGIGGTELRDRVQAEYRSEQRWIAARNLVQNETTYGDDFSTPKVDSLTDETLQTATTTDDFNDLITIEDTDPVDPGGNELELHESGAFFDSTFDFSSRTTQGPFSDSTAVEGSYEEISQNGDFIEFEHTFNYTIPAPTGGSPSDEGSRHGLRWRLETDGEAPEVDITINGNVVRDGLQPTSVSASTWEWYNDKGFFDSSLTYPDIQSGQTTTFRIEVVSETGNQDALQLDAAWIGDGRYSYNFDESDSDSNDSIAGPELYPDVERITPMFATSAFSVTDVAASLTIDDTGNNQLLQVSNDFGVTWKPDDGTEDNTSSVDHTFASPGPAAQLRFDIGRYSPNGTRSTSPNTGYDTQTVSDWTVTADIDLELLLIDEKYDQALWQILNDIAGEDFVWSYNLDSNGNGQISWSEDGQRVATSDPDFSGVEIDKDSDTFDRVTIKGSPDGISEETFTASTSFTALENADIVVGSETVYDASTNEQFTRGADYEMDYGDGEIRIQSNGNMTDGSDYTIDYNVEISGTYPSDVSNPDREFVDSVPGIVSDRGAEQIAFVLYSDAKDPRWSGNVVVPNVTNDFNPLEALPLADRDLPSGATPLEPRGSPEITPEGVSIRLGSRPPISQAFGQIAERVSTLSNRS